MSYKRKSVSVRFPKEGHKYNYKGLKTEKDGPFSWLVIKNWGEKPIAFDRDLANVPGVGRKVNPYIRISIISLTSPTTYFIHCDLIDRRKNLFNGKKSNVLARFDIKEKPFKKVSYHASSQQVLRDCLTGEYVNSITLSIRDKNRNLFDFGGMPLKFELAIN